jgi:hypothetical protein
LMASGTLVGGRPQMVLWQQFLTDHQGRGEHLCETRHLC